MNEVTMSSNHNALSELLSDPVFSRLVRVLGTTSQSILEILEYGFSTRDVSRALAKGVIEFSKPVGKDRPSNIIEYGLEVGEYYYELVREKVRLARLGLLVLEIMDSDLKQATETESDFASPAQEENTLVNSPATFH
jgi:hypothetical protein